MNARPHGDILYDRAWKSILSALEILTKAQARVMRRQGASSEELLLAGSRTLSVVAIDIARMATVAACGREPTADELRLFFDAAVDLYTRERLSN